MYARNNASPRPITIGAVVQISDGAVQTTGVSVKVRKDAGSWATGAGTLAVEEGIWSYTPTQGETDCDALQIILYKTSCIPNSMEVVFTDAAEFGQVVLAGVTHTNAVIPTVSSVTNRVTANTDQWDGVAVTGMPMPTYIQPTGFLAATFPATVASPTNITSATGIVLASTTHTGAVIPTVSTVTNGVTVSTNNDKTGYSLTQAFPTNFAALGINSSGHVSRVVLVDTTTTNTDMRGTDGAALASNWTATRAGYLDGVLIAANYNQRTVQVTGSNHVAADIHELQPAVIASTHFAAGAIDANALASSAVTEIGVGVWVSAGYAAAIRAAVGLAAADLDTQLDAIAAAVNPGAVWTDPAAATTIRAAMGLATANLDAQLAAALVLQKLAASGATGSVQVTDNGNGTATLVFKDTNGTTTLATVTYNYTSGARTRVS
jgi:hypothetical protein